MSGRRHTAPDRDRAGFAGPARGLAGFAFVLLASLFVTRLITERFGFEMLVLALLGVFLGTVYALISFRDLMFPFLVLILAIGGFQFLVSVRSPILPDLQLDRMALIWLTGVFMVKFFAERKSLRGPYLLDLFMLLNLIYVFFSMYFTDMISFNLWTKSYLLAYSTYFFAKNIVVTRGQIRVMFGIMLALVTYYSITSIAEKYNLNWLIWPKYIITDEAFRGRSIGPFKHAPLLGTIIGMMIPLYLYFIATTRNHVVKLLLYCGMIAAFGGLYFTYTRGSWLAGIAALAAVALVSRRHYMRMLLPALVLVPILAIGVVGVAQDKFMKERVENEDTLGSRIGTMVTAMRVWRANPIFGVGFYQYRFIQTDYVRTIEAPVIGTIRAAQFRHNPPHDIYFAYLAETGLVGMILQGGIYFLVFRAFWNLYRRRDDDDEFATLVIPIFAGMFVGYLIGGLAIDYRFFSVVGTLFYTCAGILYGHRPEEYHGREPSTVPVPSYGVEVPGQRNPVE